MHATDLKARHRPATGEHPTVRSSMSYEPHTARIAADETLTLPNHARGVTVEREGDAYLVHYLALTDAALETRRDAAQERMREFHSPYEFPPSEG